MFGGQLPKPRVPKTRLGLHPTPDILNTSRTPQLYGHRAPNPNTNDLARSLHYKQRSTSLCEQRDIEGLSHNDTSLYMINFESHIQRRVLRSEIKTRVQVKLQQYEASVNIRREKLKELFANEEREFVRITVENCQRGFEDKLAAMKEKSRLLKEQKRKANEEFVHKKRLEQYMIRCMDLIPAMTDKNLRESKMVQLQQMRENEARREAEKELDRMWAHLLNREIEAKCEREKQEIIIRYNKDRMDNDVIELQIEGKRLLKEEERRIAIEDRIELQRLAEKRKQEEIGAQGEARKKRDQMCADLLKQVEIQKSFMAQRKKEEDTLDNSFAQLTQIELEKELSQNANNTDILRKEATLYRKHLKDVQEQRLEEQRKLDEMLKEYQCEINKKFDLARCELQEARERLQAQTMKERDQQLEDKRLMAEKMLQMKQAENDWIQMVIETNDRLNAEHQRLSKMAAQQYRHDLNKQIEYNNLNKERENRELERQLEKGREEEQRYKALVAELISQGHSAGSVKHPFRIVIDKNDCHCAPMLPKY